jgi:hypothetical protein
VESTHTVFHAQHLIVMDATGILDLAASIAALKKLAANPEFDTRAEILLDLRDVECRMSINDLYDLAVILAWPDPALPTQRKIAILVDGALEFDHARFLALCAVSRGVAIRAFDGYDAADGWLTAALPLDPKENVVETQLPPTQRNTSQTSRTS